MNAVRPELAFLRTEYVKAGLREEDAALDPFPQFSAWFDQAQATEVREPNAMVLATATPEGEPSARVVLLKGFDRRGLVFFTNYDSGKGETLERNARAALVFFWPELERQVRVEGVVAHTSREESETYFHKRPRGSQLGALASRQSTVIASRQVLDAELAALEEKFSGAEVPLPASWGGYRVNPHLFEFWQGRPNRLHDRLRYLREGDDWQRVRLSP